MDTSKRQRAGGVFKSIDGGRTWNRLTNGLPKLMGRIGVKVAPSNSNTVYVIVESKEGTLYRSDDRGETFKQVSKDSRIVSRGFYYTDLRVDPVNENRIYAVASTLFVSIDGGRSFRSITGRTHIDYHALWIDPKNPSRIWQGQDGGFAVSYDAGEKWEYVNNIPLGQFYQIHADNRRPFYYISGGLQDNGGWTGPSRTREPAGILNDDWRMVNFGDGFHVINHPDDPDVYLSESQGGNIVRTDMITREQQSVSPQPRGGAGPASSVKYRFNWNAPIAPSPHEKNTVFFAGNVVFKTTDFGRTWEPISPDLTTNDPEKQKDAGGPIAFENSTAEYHCTIISLAESPVRQGLIWAGTDDGNLQLTNDGGKNWTNLIKNVPRIEKFSPVSHVEPSRTGAEVAYAAFDRHMFDDFRPYVYKTADGGKSWANISGNLPAGAYVHVVREDPKNRSLLYAGTELGLFASYTGGREWVRLGLKNLPHVPVHDILVHPRENDLILGTHGRGIWVFDDATPIQQMNTAIQTGAATLFDVRPAIRFTTRFTRYGIGDKVFAGPNPPSGALITYYLKDKPDEKTKVTIQIVDQSGRVIRELEKVDKESGLNRAVWDLRYSGPRPRRQQSDDENPFGGGPRGPLVLPGTYRVKFLVGDAAFEKQVEVRLDPAVATSNADLEAQLDLLMKLKIMQNAGNDALRLLDSVKEQLEQLQKTVKDRMPDAPKELGEAISKELKKAEELQNQLSRPRGGLGLTGGAQIVDRVNGLFSTVDGVNAAPTPYQKAFFEQIQPEFTTTLADVNGFLGQTMEQLNNLLRRHNAPIVVAGKVVVDPR
jgi:photosystem II stability/assembly factor-like uncharacterized protein